MAAHRYWRVQVLSDPQGVGNTSAAELQMMETIGGANVCTGGTALSSSDYSGFPKTNAFDSNASTFWAANNSYPVYIGYDLGVGVTKDIRAFVWQIRSDSNIQAPITGNMQWSDDGTNWTTYWSFNSYATTSNFNAGAIMKVSDPLLDGSTIWNQSDMGTSCFVDDAKRRARILASAVNGGARATRYLQTSLVYWEVVVESGLTGSCRVGIALDSAALSTLLGNDTGNAAIALDAGGTVRRNNTTVATIFSFTSGDRIGIAVDNINKLIWFRKNNGNWNNDVIANQNPVGAVGGISFSALSGSIKPAFGGTFSSGVKANFVSTDWVDTAPSGYSALNVVPSVAVSGSVADRAASFTTYKGSNSLGGQPGTNINAIQANRSSVKPSAWYGYSPCYSPAGPATAISGVVKETGSVIAGKTVYLYEASTGRKLGSAVSDGSGAFTIPALGRTNVFAVAQDPTYQAIVYDQLTPV